MDVIDIVLGVVGICFGSWKYVKGTGNRSKPLGMIIFIFGIIFLVRGFLGLPSWLKSSRPSAHIAGNKFF